MVGVKDWSTDLLMEYGVYSPILHPYQLITLHHQTQQPRLKIDSRSSALIIRTGSVRDLPELRGC